MGSFDGWVCWMFYGISIATYWIFYLCVSLFLIIWRLYLTLQSPIMHFSGFHSLFRFWCTLNGLPCTGSLWVVHHIQGLFFEDYVYTLYINQNSCLIEGIVYLTDYSQISSLSSVSCLHQCMLKWGKSPPFTLMTAPLEHDLYKLWSSELIS